MESLYPPGLTLIPCPSVYVGVEGCTCTVPKALHCTPISSNRTRGLLASARRGPHLSHRALCLQLAAFWSLVWGGREDSTPEALGREVIPDPQRQPSRLTVPASVSCFQSTPRPLPFSWSCGSASPEHDRLPLPPLAWQGSPQAPGLCGGRRGLE